MILLFLFHQSVFFPYSFDKNPFFPLPSLGHVFPCHRDNFHVFSRVGKEIFLPVFIIFVLFSGLSGRKIRIFRNEFPLRMNIFPFSRQVFPDFFRISWEIFLPVFIIFALLPEFSGKKFVFSWMNFPSGRIFSSFSGSIFQSFLPVSGEDFYTSRIFFAPSGRNFHLSGSFSHGLYARAFARA